MIRSLPVDSIDLPSFGNCRRDGITAADVHDLAKDIAANGLLHAIIVRTKGDRFELICGHRRFAAVTKVLAWSSIEARIIEVHDDRQCGVMQLSENLERKSLNVVDEALAVERLFPTSMFSAYDAANALNKHQSWVLARRRLLRLPEHLQNMFAAGRLPISRVSDLPDNPNADRVAAELLKRPNKHSRCAAVERRKTKKDIRAAIKRMLEAGIGGLAPKALSWSIGQLPDADFQYALNETVRTGR
jgi:ParB family chromosome partitioning protein